MTNYDRLNLKIANQENIFLSRGNEIFRTMLSLVTFLFILSFSFIFFHFKISIITVFTFISFSFLYLFLLRTKKKYVSASIKGEMLLLQDGSNKNKVTSIKSIKSISTYTIFGINFTRITYKLDGRKHQICLLKKLDSEQLENEEIIKTVMKFA